MASLPGLSLTAPTPSGSTAQSAAAFLPPRTEELPARSELRFEVAFGKTYRIRVLRGTAEIFGTELAPTVTYTFTGTKAAVFTWHGCSLELQGEVESEYVGSETDAMAEWLNVHGMLETVRDDANAGSTDGGPRVLIVGPDNTGKTSLVKCLTAWSVKTGRCPTVVNLDPREGLLSIPGSITAVTISSTIDVEEGWGSSPISGPTNIPVKTPLVYHYPFASPSDAPSSLFKPLVTRAALAVTSRLEEDPAAKSSGIIIDTPGSLNSPRDAYSSIAHIASEFSVNVLLVLGSERLYSDMARRFANPKTAEDTVHVFRISTTGGAVARDETFMRSARQQQIKAYFFGDAKTSLNPHGQWWDFGDLPVYRAIDRSAASSTGTLNFLPGMDDEDEGVSAAAAMPSQDQSAGQEIFERVTPSQAMVNAIVAIKFCSGKAGQEMIRDSCVMGFAYVAEVDEGRKKIRFLAPHPSRWGDRALVWGSWPEGVGDLVA
ncbi:hypothetical protein BT93_L4275 [Corymbia citriodora subsp. variegata]|uniref:Protein CLP1 homolog n=1 Tax=Corymbia citriodora subsp. variegata TaxID=360336 RepID=A0A8T0CL16_CORYI|nr:hypothetical protein BT93_L4275 [Corymbia citriodora subsp. variegata]